MVFFLHIENFNQDMPGLLRYIDQVRKKVRNFEKKYSTYFLIKLSCKK